VASIHPAAIWPQHIWADIWGKGCGPLGKEGAGSPSNTMWPGLWPTCVPSFILIHPTIWPQTATLQTGETDRRTDRTTVR